ncbi:ferritin-like domain-containing protein [Bordetella hinzii]|uniref:ferritin-like domain-containing protein n=1 Tax=Bordetella hinzii TaxID=103855 RepID=UPI0013EFE779|nr:ferritin-like domain-containing protein [Bordetella hinzii]QII83994.1 ferritin-like domain-containing protein [Bordetella hinzii]
MKRNDEGREQVLDWLRDAHAMEAQAETMLEAMASRLKNYPELESRIREHIDQTRSQAARVRTCIERLGGDTSTLKDAAGKFMATMQGFSGAMASDEVVKGCMFSYAFENMEVAAYRILIVAARQVGEPDIAAVCSDILEEEIAMARWLEEHLESVVGRFLGSGVQDGPKR